MEKEEKSAKTNKKILILIISLCILLVGIVMAIIFVATKTSTPETDPRSFEEIYWDSETAEEAIETFQQKIDATTDPEQKTTLYTERSNYLLQFSKEEDIFYSEILSDLKMIDELNPTADSAYNIYVFYQNRNEATNANQYLEIFLEREQNEY